MLKPWITQKIWCSHYRSNKFAYDLGFICIFSINKEGWLRNSSLLICDSNVTPSISILSHNKFADPTLFYFIISSIGKDVYHFVALKIDVFVTIGRVEPEVNSPIRDTSRMPFKTNWYLSRWIISDIWCRLLKSDYNNVKISNYTLRSRCRMLLAEKKNRW